MRPTTRFAPSPTGALHLGHAFSALLAWRFARAAGGRFRLRIEDIDTGRCREAHVAGILADLAWLGLDWDGPVERQSAQLGRYAQALDRLRGAGLLYPCFCSRADIAAAASAPHGPAGAPYPGTCRALGAAERAERLARMPHAWRLDMAAATARAGPLAWHDLDAGPVRARPEAHGDIVLARRDAPASYHLAVTLDDAAQGITHVIRGEDLRAATCVHRLLQALLGLPVPAWRHHAMLTDAGGRRLAKRHGAMALATLRAAGQSPASLLRGIGALPSAPGRAMWGRGAL